MYLYCDRCGQATPYPGLLAEDGPPPCPDCNWPRKVLCDHNTRSTQVPTSEFFDGYDLWLEREFSTPVEEPPSGDTTPTEEQLARQFGVPLTDPDNVVDDPGDRQGWND